MYMCLQSREEREKAREEREQAQAQDEDLERVAFVQLLRRKVMKMNEARYREFESMVNAAANK